MALKLSHYYRVSRPVFDQIEERTKRAIFVTRTASFRVIDEWSWQRIEQGDFDLLPPEILDELIAIELLVPEQEDELQTIIQQNQSVIDEDDNLYLVVQPTAYCQLGCHYCGQEHSPQKMNEEAQKKFIERTRNKLETKKFTSLSIGWFGGEPLVGLSVIRSLTPQLKALAEEFNCSYQAKIVTNGLALTEKIARELVEDLHITTIEITLDGTQEYHDIRRIQKSGRPTFSKIFTNVVNLAQRDDLEVNLIIRCNVDYQNYESVSLLLRELATAKIQDKISFYVAPIHSWGNDAHKQSLSHEEFAELEIFWLSEMIELGFNPGLIPSRVPIVCMAVQTSAELVDAYGNIFNCTEVSYVPTYGTPNEYAIDHLSGQKMPGNRERLGNFNNQVSQKTYPCSTCKMLPVCGGSCPKSWLEGIEPCPSAKYNIEDRLLLNYALSRLTDETSETEKCSSESR
ncbi:radical SAM/SPASM domain-containing protein [Crocosphaera chwakensis]|uniref:Radical SAM n=1 Tax=Crocosphaera chwakensis CCY0110 TaxID=391612 RepID=A3IY88_9CHRO|nr:radical SAM protein [Crocosphaera chwakensis]EAZ88571.1 Radical SAM [Crocosphaera chwakensis CCY0110]